jgi:hypothetical protein
MEEDRKCDYCETRFVPRKGGRPQRTCGSVRCKNLMMNEYHRKYSHQKRNENKPEKELTVILPEGHKVLPLVAEAVHMKNDIRVALGAMRLGRYKLAQSILSKYVE